jgi:hypothetical protein
MTSLFVLVVSFLLLRGVGWLGVKQLSSWRDAGRGALVTMFLFTGISLHQHEVRLRGDDPRSLAQ